jgi:hypothetical protein
MARQTSRQQRRAKARRELAKPAQKTFDWTPILGVVLIAGILAVLAVQVFNQNNYRSSNAVSSTTPAIDGIKCGPTEGTSYHVHSHLSIFDQGRPVQVPAQTGIGSTCLYWVHTHDTTGVIHIEAPVRAKPTLGAFFDIWVPHCPVRKWLV